MATVDELHAVVEKMISTVSMLCEETASLVEERSHREAPGRQDGVREKAGKIREAGHLLEKALDRDR